MSAPRPPNDQQDSPAGGSAGQPAAGQRKATISGPIGVNPGRLSPEEQASALALLSAVLGDQKSWPRVREKAPAPEEDSNIALGAPNGKRLKLDDLLAQALTKIGYRRVAKLTYRADWSTSEVEHILTFDTYGTPKAFLTGDIGFRNQDADAFAEQCSSRYADPIIRKSDFVPPPWWCWMHCSLGMLANWKGANLYTPDYSQAELGGRVAAAVRDFLLPYVGGVTTIGRLFDFLAKDTEPMRWFRTGGYFRAAEVAFLGSKLGVTSGKLVEILRPYGREMRNGIDMKMMTPDDYIARIVHDAGEAASAEAK
jgi:hypothetical protein